MGTYSPIIRYRLLRTLACHQRGDEGPRGPIEERISVDDGAEMLHGQLLHAALSTLCRQGSSSNKGCPSLHAFFAGTGWNSKGQDSKKATATQAKERRHAHSLKGWPCPRAI